MTQNGEDPGATPGEGETSEAPPEPTIADLQAKIEEMSGQYAKLKDDFIRMRRKTGSGDREDPPPKPKQEQREAGLSERDIDARIEYRMAAASLSDEHRREVEEMLEEAGPRAAVRLARALAAGVESSEKKRNPARAGTAAPPPAARQWSPAEVLRLPPDEKRAVLARIRKGEDSFTE